MSHLRAKLGRTSLAHVWFWEASLGSVVALPPGRVASRPGGGRIAEATGWQAHTVRGFFAGLKKKGIEVSVLERLRQVGLNKAGAKDSYTVYRVTEAG